jgi:hypothetical protein
VYLPVALLALAVVTTALLKTANQAGAIPAELLAHTLSGLAGSVSAASWNEATWKRGHRCGQADRFAQSPSCDAVQGAISGTNL